MSQRVANSITNNIEKIQERILKIENEEDAKIIEIRHKYAEKIAPLKDRIEKYEAMLEVLNPTTSTDKEKVA